MPEPLPRPGPMNETLILTRRPKSGFVNYPPFFQRRMVEGRARFMTKCDMLIGPCACGYTHCEWEGWVLDTLQMYNCQVEIIILWGIKLATRGMVVEIPGYWKQGRNWERTRCDVLVGQCTCGCTHVASEEWVKDLLNKHRGVILNMPEVEAFESERNRPSRPSRPSHPSRSSRSSRPSRSRLERDRTEVFEEAADGCGGTWVREQPISSDCPDEMNQTVEDLVSDVVAGRLVLPTAIQGLVDNRGLPGCNCSDCERLGERGLENVARVWIQESVTMAQADPSQERREWEQHNINEAGQLPGWCNCDSCTSYRLYTRNQGREEDSEVCVEPQEIASPSSVEQITNFLRSNRIGQTPEAGATQTPEAGATHWSTIRGDF